MIKWLAVQRNKAISISILTLVIGVGGGFSCSSPKQKAGNDSQQINNKAKESPVALQPTKQNNGKRCASRNYYLEIDRYEKEKNYSECYRLQERLIKAAGKGDLQGIKEALKYGANIEGTYYSSFPALHTAAMAGQTQAVLLLLDNEANINMIADFENYPIEMAASAGHLDTVKVLLERGADVCFKTSAGTPDQSARARGYKEIEELLKAARESNCK